MTPIEEGREAELQARLRETLPDPPLDAVDWAGLHARILMRSAPLLRTGRTSRPGVWQTLSAWASRGIPLTAAAAAALALLLGYGPDRRVDAAGAQFRTVEEELADGLSAGSAPLLMAGASDDELLDALLFYEEGDR